MRHSLGGAAGLERGRGVDGAPGLVAGRFQGHVAGRALALCYRRVMALFVASDQNLNKGAVRGVYATGCTRR